MSPTKRCDLITALLSIGIVTMCYQLIRHTTPQFSKLNPSGQMKMDLGKKNITKSSLVDTVLPRNSDSGNSFRETSAVNISDELLMMIRAIQEKMAVIDPSPTEFRITCKENSGDGIEDLLCMNSPKFLPTFKNPCWYSENKHFYCLPYFHLIGVGKCASTDLFGRILRHPDILENDGHRHKETMFWSWNRYGFNRNGLINPSWKITFHQYLNFFRSPSATILKSPKRDYITGDGSPVELMDNLGWPFIPQNQGLSEPKYINAHLIKHMNPDVKLLVILRDPVERLFSDYVFRGSKSVTAETFHDTVVRGIHLLYACVLKTSLRNCIYDRDLRIQLKLRLLWGFYVMFLQDWFQVFPRKQFLIIKTEDYKTSMVQTLQKVFNFLGVRELPTDNLTTIASYQHTRVTTRKQFVGDMKTETRHILRELFSSFNRQLAILLNDERFLWK